MSQPLILAIDQGGQSTRGAIYNPQGEQLHCFSATCATGHRQVNAVEYIEQNPQEILQGIQHCLQQIQQALGDDAQYIIAAGFAGQGSSLLCWDKYTGEALSPVLSWQDVRGQAYLKGFALTHAQLQVLTGLRASPHYGASKMRWCLEHYPQVAAAHRQHRLCIGPIVSYVLQNLCGTYVVDPGHAQRTLLWNLAQNNWDEQLLALFHIPRPLLPECKSHNSHFGFLRLGANTIPVTACARDQGASLFARGYPSANTCYVNLGTGAFIQRLSENLLAPEGLLVSPLWLPDAAGQQQLYAWEATVNGAASALGYLQEQTGLAVTPAQIASALTLTPENDCYFLNAIGGLGAPYWRTDLQPQFSKHLSAEEKILAWLESIIFQIHINVGLMAQSAKLTKLYISGGFSNADMLCQKMADLLQLAVCRSDNADASLQGIAFMAAGMPGSWLHNSSQQIFTPQVNMPLLRRFSVWQRAMADWLKA